MQSGDEVTLMGRYLMHEIDGTHHGLLKVKLGDGREGYISANHLRSIGDTPAPKPEPKPAPKPGEGPKPSPDFVIGKSNKPIAKLTGKPNRVISPYPPHNVLNVEGLDPGSVATDPTTEGLFEVPEPQKIPEPAPKPKVPEPDKRRGILAYRVDSTDTIQSILNQFGMTEEDFRKLNKL